MPEGVVEKLPDRAAVWTFQEAEAVGGSEVDSFNSRAEICTLRSQTHSFSTTLHFWLYLPNAEMTLDLEVNEVEVKVLTSLASVTETTGKTVLTSPLRGDTSLCINDTRILFLFQTGDTPRIRALAHASFAVSESQTTQDSAPDGSSPFAISGLSAPFSSSLLVTSPLETSLNDPLSATTVLDE